ncbi:MAG: hypothetical protein AMXMBFR47_08280 [Planctomycetota bacterium]
MLAAGVVGRAVAQAEFTWIDLPAGAIRAEAYAVSDGDDPTIVGVCYFGGDNRAFRWRAGEGYLILPEENAAALAVSADGSVVVGVRPSGTGFLEAFRWTPDGVIGAGIESSATCVTADGTAAFGSRADTVGNFRWTESFELIIPGVRPVACNSDGTWFVGQVGGGGPEWGTAVRASIAAGIEPLGDLPGGEVESHPTAISDDGTVVVGTSWSTVQEEAFRWTPETGMVGLGSLPGYSESQALGMAADGSLIVGAAGTRGMVWDSVRGMRAFRDMVQQDYGLTVADVGEIRAVSRDGRNIAGWAQEGSHPRRLWLLHIEQCCTPADMDCNLRVDIADLAVFLAHFGHCSSDPDFWPRADIDRRGCVDLPDLSQLLAQFGDHCQ